MRSKVLIGYKRLFRAGQTLFKGDEYALKQFKQEIRSQFEAKRHLKDEEQITKSLQDIDETVDMLENYFVQGKKNAEGNFEVKINPGDKVSEIDTELPDIEITKTTK